LNTRSRGGSGRCYHDQLQPLLASRRSAPLRRSGRCTGISGKAASPAIASFHRDVRASFQFGLGRRFQVPTSRCRHQNDLFRPMATRTAALRQMRSFIDRMLWNVDRINVCMCGRLPPFPRGLLPRPRYKLGNGKFGCYQLSRSRNSAMMVASFVVMLSTPRA